MDSQDYKILKTENQVITAIPDPKQNPYKSSQQLRIIQ